MSETREGGERSRDVDRFLTFLDAVVAIAITLLVLPLVELVGELPETDSVSGLLDEHSADLWGFLLSFGVIGNFWFAQHRVMRTVVVEHHVVTRLLFLWLLTIVVLPFPTALVAHSGDEAVTKVFYVGTMAAGAGLLAVLGVVIARTPSIRDGGRPPDPTPSVVTFVVLVVALVLSLAVPSTGYFPLLLLLLGGPLQRLWHRLRGRPGPGS